MASQRAIDILMKGMKKEQRPYWLPSAAPMVSHNVNAEIMGFSPPNSSRASLGVVKNRKKSRY